MSVYPHGKCIVTERMAKLLAGHHVRNDQAYFTTGDIVLTDGHGKPVLSREDSLALCSPSSAVESLASPSALGASPYVQVEKDSSFLTLRDSVSDLLIAR